MRVPGGLIDGERAYGSAGLLGRIQSAHAASLLTIVTPATAPAKARPQALRSTFNKVMVSVMVLAGVSSLATGTLASFNASTANPNNTFQSGTLALSDNVQAQTCFSYGTLTAGQFTNNNANPGCNSIAFAAVAKPGDPASTANFTLKNVGSLNGATITISASACVTTNDAEAFHGTGDLCAQLVVAVQEMTDATFATNKQCWYPTTVVTCPLTSTVAALQTASPATVTGGLTAAGSAGDTRYFQVQIQLPTSTNNTFQGRVATFTLTWELDQ